MKHFILILLLLSCASFPKAHADEEADSSRETYILLHALNDALQATNFYDCRIAMTDQSLAVDRARFHAEVAFYARRTEIKAADGWIIISGYHPEDDGWHQQEFTFRLSASQKSIRGVRYRESRIDHVNTGTITHPVYKTVLTPVQKFYCGTN